MKELGKLLILLVVVSGCLTRGKYESRLESWVGHDVGELFQDWGPPTSTFDLPDGRKMYTWSDDRGAQGGVVAGRVYAVKVGCEITFTASKSGTVEGWRYKGNNCF